MKRLTGFNERTGQAYIEGYAGYLPAEMQMAFVQAVVKKCWEYENTGLEPEEAEACKVALMGKTLAEIKEIEGLSIERMKELAKAESEGRLLVLPCKIGDTVFRICHEYKKGNPFIRSVTFNNNNFWRIVFGGEFGKTVFLTREEAEEALKKESET